MKYKVIDYVSKKHKVKEGTCDICFRVRSAEQGYIVLEDEKHREKVINLYEWNCSYCDEIEIDSVIDFSDWLSKTDVKVIPSELALRVEWLKEIVIMYERARDIGYGKTLNEMDKKFEEAKKKRNLR